MFSFFAGLLTKRSLLTLLLATVSLTLIYPSSCRAYRIDIDLDRIPIPEMSENDITLTSSRLWDQFSFSEKVKAVTAAKDKFRTVYGIKIYKSSEFYVSAINDIRRSVRGAERVPIGALLRITAVMEYDFDEGIDREVTAQRWLGEYYRDFKESQVTGNDWEKLSRQQKRILVENYMMDNGYEYSPEALIDVVDFIYSEENGAFRYLTMRGVLNNVINCDVPRQKMSSQTEQM